MPDVEQDSRQALLTALTAEHLALQAAADATFTDAAARSSLYVLSLSSALVATGFLSQSPNILPVFVSIVLPSIFLMGVLTVVRLVDSALENNQYLAGIARIRAYYRTLSQDAATLFASSAGRWPEGPDPALGLGLPIAFMGTTATMVAFLNSVVAGVGVALLVDVVFRAPVILRLAGGLLMVAILMTAFFAFQRWRFSMTPGISGTAMTVEGDDPPTDG